ncbi:MAG: hypothetical protein JW884_00660 [Deltaproteobacteria bacterium]|nr:hypothetical protein [Deltaproteobacteria bacterium]
MRHAAGIIAGSVAIVALAIVIGFVSAKVPSRPLNSFAAAFLKRLESMSHTDVISEISTPWQARQYLLNYLSYASDRDTYGEEDFIAPFRRIHAMRRDDCDGGALAAAALLSDNGYNPLMLCMYSNEHTLERKGGHSVYIYPEGGKWATLGIRPHDCNPPVFDSVEEIVRFYGFQKFAVVNIEEVCPDWIEGASNMSEKLYRPDLAKNIIGARTIFLMD